MPMEPGPHQEALQQAIALEAEGQRALLAGEPGGADALRGAAQRYRESWELAPPRSYGRLIGMLKALVIAGDAEDGARYALDQLGNGCDSAPSCYALALARLALGDDEAAETAAAGMHGASPAFENAAAAIEALAARDQAAYERAIAAIVADFEGRDAHLTGVPIADTALMLECLAEPRGMACGPSSPLLPA